MLQAKGADGQPMLIVFNTCRHYLRTFPALVIDDHNPEDIDTKQEDHIYDETRYAVMSRNANRSFIAVGSVPWHDDVSNNNFDPLGRSYVS